MNFQALLFCQDEKTARLTTQLLRELEFSVEISAEPFAAVKKLMAQHFDAVVVDCDNEQNASLLFKGARNSQLNQSSLAVAVVEGQAGVANAFRIGANLVLTKPINVEQAKGTLRVARGLLKKGGESGKPASPAASAAPATPSSPPPIAAAKPAAASSAPTTRPAVPAGTAAKPAPMISPLNAPAPAPIAKSNPDPGNIFEIDAESEQAAEPILMDVLDDHSASAQPISKPEVKRTSSAVPPQSVPKPLKEVLGPSSASVTSAGGSAAAPAVAKAAVGPEFEKFGDTSPSSARLSLPATAPTTPPVPAQAPGLFAQPQSVPTFGSLDATEGSKSGGMAKIAIVAVVIAVLGAAAYFGYTKVHKQQAEPVIQNSQPAVAPPEASATVTSTPLPPPSPQIKEKLEAADHSPAATATDSSSHKNTSATLDDSEPEVVVKNIEPEPRVVKANPARPNGTAKKKDAEVEAPSVLGSATADASSLPTIVTSAPVAVPSAAAPEMLRVSQGVTQGLLIRRVQPVYPQSAMQMRIAGTVQLLAVISKTGDVANVKILTGEPVLARAAVDAVRQWKYKPYLLDGEPVEIQTQVTINFKLP